MPQSISMPPLALTWLTLSLALVALLMPAHTLAATETEFRLTMRAQATDNLYYTDQQTQSASGLIIKPSVQVLRQTRGLQSALNLGGTFAAFNLGNDDNYTDGVLQGRFAYARGRSQYNFVSTLMLGHDPFGSARTEGQASFTAELDRWRDLGVEAGWTRGFDGRGLIASSLTISGVQRRYISNRSATRFIDNDRVSINLLLGRNLSPKLTLLADLSSSEVDFVDDAGGRPGRSGSTEAFLVGLKWKATANTTGDIRIGGAQRDSNNSRRFDREFWRVDIKWDPTATDTLRFNTARSFVSSYLQNTLFIDVQSVNIRWSHDWTDVFTTQASTTYEQRDLIGTQNSDDVLRGSFDFAYRMDRAFTLRLGLNYSERDSSRSGLDFERGSITFGFTAQLN